MAVVGEEVAAEVAAVVAVAVAEGVGVEETGLEGTKARGGFDRLAPNRLRKRDRKDPLSVVVLTSPSLFTSLPPVWLDLVGLVGCSDDDLTITSSSTSAALVLLSLPLARTLAPSLALVFELALVPLRSSTMIFHRAAER